MVKRGCILMDGKLELCRQIVDDLDVLAESMTDYARHPHHYGIDTPLYPKQIHLLAYIGQNPGCNLVALSSLTGKTKGTISLQLDRLIALGLITKEKSAESRREIVVSLTDKGKTACRFYEEIDHSFFSFLLDRIPDFTLEQMETISSFVKLMIAAYED